MNYLAENLAGFFKLLRTGGMNISIYDCLTSVDALQHVDITDRLQVKTAFKACLAKDPQGREIVSRAFDLYFVPQNTRKEYVEAKADLIEKRKQEIHEAVSELRFQDTPLELSDENMEVYSGLPAIEKHSIKDFLDKTSAGKNVRTEFKQLAETMVKSRLAGLKTRYEKQLARTMGVLAQDTSEAGILAGEVLEDVLKSDNLMRKNIGDIGDEDVPTAIKLISLMVDKLKKELSRKYKRTGKITRLDLKRTIRSNLSTGQAMFKLKYKSRWRSKNKLLLVCDVSASMLRFSGFVLNFMTGMSRGFLSLECYIFSEDTEKINLRSYGGLSTFEDHVKAGAIWAKGTNIGVALGNILKDRMSSVSSSTVLVVVSDAKTVDHGLAENNLKELSSKVKRVLWLNPVPQSEWNRIRGLEAFSRYCSMLDCSTLERLEAACRKL